jgi:hypothetical protein
VKLAAGTWPRKETKARRTRKRMRTVGIILPR